MSGNDKRIYNLLFFLSLVIFVALKIPDLSLPFYWDELGVYSRSSIYLAQHKLSLMPVDLPSDYSRGHPLLFPFIYGSAFRLFGIGTLTGHILSLIISVILLLKLYYIIGRESNAFVAWLSVLLLMAQPVFFAQSIFVLPEILLALFMVMALYACYRKNLWGFALFASMAMLVKETAVILPAIAIAYYLLMKFAKRQVIEPGVKSVLLIIFPWLVFGLFLLVQKSQNGWFFFPLHINNVSFELSKVLAQNHDIQKFLFFSQGRYWWVKVFLIGALVSFMRGRFRLYPGFALVGVIFLLGFILFSSINFYMDRYAMAALPFLSWFVVECAAVVWKNKAFISAVIFVLVAVHLQHMDTNVFNYDCDMSYKRLLNVEQKAVDYVCENVFSDELPAINFPMNFILSEGQTGFSVKRYIRSGYYNPEHPQKYIIYGSNTYDFSFPKWDYEPVARFDDGFASVVIWRRKI
jgi:hypothetical protein